MADCPGDLFGGRLSGQQHAIVRLRASHIGADCDDRRRSQARTGVELEQQFIELGQAALGLAAANDDHARVVQVCLANGRRGRGSPCYDDLGLERTDRQSAEDEERRDGGRSDEQDGSTAYAAHVPSGAIARD